eukprot:2241751-Pyramimonas_sp.AAC.1
MLAEAKRAEVEEAKQEAAYRSPNQEASVCTMGLSGCDLLPGGFGFSPAMMTGGAMPRKRSGPGEGFGVVKAMPTSRAYSPTMP